MTAEELVQELSLLKSVLVLKEEIDMDRFNILYDKAFHFMLTSNNDIKDLMEEFFYFRQLAEE